MSSKKKLIISVCSMALVVVAAIVAVVAVWAAGRQEVNTTFKITYTAEDVAVKVSGKYVMVGGDTTTVAELQTQAGAKELNITPEMNEGDVPAFEIADFNLPNKQSVVVFEYVFVNQSDVIDVAATLTNVADALSKNVSITFYTVEDEADRLDLSSLDADDLALISDSTATSELEAGTGNTIYCYIKMAVANAANDVNFEGGLNWALVGTHVA